MEILDKFGKPIPRIITKGDELNPWDAAHDYLDGELAAGQKPEFVEPDLRHRIFSAQDPEYLASQHPELEAFDETEYLKNWPRPDEGTDRFVWHLTDKYSEFFKA